MTTRTLAITLILAGVVAGQVEPPLIGLTVDRQGALRPVLGVAGAFRLGEPLLSGVVDAAFNGRIGGVKRAAELLVLDGAGKIIARREVAEGGARFWLERDRLTVCIEQGGECWSWSAGPGWQPAAEPVAGAEPVDLPAARGVLRLRGSGRVMDAPFAVDRAAPLGEGWWRLTAADGRSLALRLAAGREEGLYELPDAGVEVEQ